VGLVEAQLVHQVLVRGAHALAVVGAGAAEGVGQEVLLVLALFGHVDIDEEVLDAIVRQYLVVEDVDCGLDRRGTAEFFVEGGHCLLLVCLRVIESLNLSLFGALSRDFAAQGRSGHIGRRSTTPPITSPILKSLRGLSL
jgi:hypothetical protein